MNKLFIPKKINVGCQSRQGTYTGKLAYVIYWDDKGKLRKEASWNSWRDKKILPQEFENTPTEGFVLNKKAGGYSSGWNHRQTYCRVYDPRGFEFEINIPNLLFILQECNAYKGKGLEGEFVYAWDGTDLVLLPAHCPEYKDSVKFTELQNKSIGVKDLEPGCYYKTKKDEKELMYLGKFNYRNNGYGGDGVINKTHIFINPNGKGDYWNPRFIGTDSLTSFAEKITDAPTDEFAGYLEEFSKSRWSASITELKGKKANIKFPTDNSNYYYWGYSRRVEQSNSQKVGEFYLEEDNGIFRAYTIYIHREVKDKKDNYARYKEDFNHWLTLTSNKIKYVENGELITKSKKLVDDTKYTEDEIKNMKFVTIGYDLESKKSKEVV